MQLEMTNSICPLCRRTVSTGDSQPVLTRLCIDCRTLVYTIVPNGKATAAATVAPQTGFVPPQFESALAEEHGFFDDLVETESPVANRFENLQTAEEEYQLYNIEDEAEATPDEQDDYYEDETMPQAAPNTGPLEQPPFFYEEPPTQAQELEQEAASYADAPASEPAAAAETATDPWDDPLPAWEYSRSEWPVPVEDDQPGRWMRLRSPLLIILALASVVALYYFVYRPMSGGGQAQETSEAPASATPAPDETSQAPVQPATGAASVVENGSPVTTDVLSAEKSQAEGKYTLQVAALPDEASARDYSERLMRAGISTYIIPVESGRRKFFRVRVGRFQTAEEAQRYAAQSRLRARAAGLALNFMVVEYVKP